LLPSGLELLTNPAAALVVGAVVCDAVAAAAAALDGRTEKHFEQSADLQRDHFHSAAVQSTRRR
jgi:hypothetical protein